MTIPDDPRSDPAAELAALADGTLAPDRRRELEGRLDADPELAAALGRQRRAVALLRHAAAEAETPMTLREQVESQRARGTAARVRGRRPRLLLLASAAAAIVAAVLVALPSGTPGAPSVVQAAQLARLTATGPAPALDPARPSLLTAAQSGVPFPAWRRAFGWRSSGTRTDRLDGRSATTVFYAKAGRRLGYTIVSGPALEQPARRRTAIRSGTRVTIFALGGQTAVTWLRDGHSCVLTGRGVSAEVLVKLATWKGRGTVPF